MAFTTKLGIFVALAALSYQFLSVKKIAIGGLGLYKEFNRQVLALQGLTPDDAAHQYVGSGQAWDEFCDNLKAAGGAILAPGAPRDALTQAEGYRYLARLTRGGLENFLEAADIDAPVLTTIVDGYRAAPIKIGSDNPDNLYQSATISGLHEYRIIGDRGTVKYLGFGTQSGVYGQPGGLSTVDYIDASKLHIEDDGSFELILSNVRPDEAKNWLRTVSDPPLGLFILRQTFLDRASESPVDVRIERIGGKGTPATLTPAKVEQALTTTGTFVSAVPLLFNNWVAGFKKHSNQLPLFDQQTSNKMGGDPNIRYYHSYWEIAEGEALVIDAPKPPSDYWNFQLNNHWMESLDYRYFTIHVNSHSAKYNDDGSFTIIIAHQNPNAHAFKGNWIQTADHFFGTMCFRWVNPTVSDDVLPHPATRLVKLSEL